MSSTPSCIRIIVVHGECSRISIPRFIRLCKYPLYASNKQTPYINIVTDLDMFIDTIYTLNEYVVVLVPKRYAKDLKLKRNMIIIPCD